MAAHAARQVHILGIGSLGKLIAHALGASSLAPTVTLLLHRPDLASLWEQAGHGINVVTDGISTRRNGYRLERTYNTSDSLIEHLIVTTKTYATIEALRPLAHRLSRKSTILFLQNGMGNIEEVSRTLFASPTAHPQIFAGVVDHGVYQTDPFSVVHAGKGSISLGASGPLHEAEESTDIERHYLLECLTTAPALSASTVSRTELAHSQLDKLAVNAIINPLTAIFDCLNGDLFNNPPIRDLIRALLVEISAVIQSIAFHAKASGGSRSTERFSPRALEGTVASVAAKTAQNISSMRQDARIGKRTEVDYINGFIIGQGVERGIDCPMNRALVQIVHDNRIISEAQIGSHFHGRLDTEE